MATGAASRRHRGLLVLVLAVALGLRLWFGLAEAGPLRYDSIDYLRHGVSIAAGHGYPPSLIAARGGPTALRAPAYPYVLGAEFALSSDTADAARALNAVLGALAVLLVYLVGARIWPRPVALTAAALAAVFPPLVGLSTSVLSEPLFIVLELTACLVALRGARDPAAWRWALLAGLVCGLAGLTRGAGLVIVLPIAWAFWRRSAPRGERRTALLPPALVLAAALMTIAPWIVRNAVELHAFVPVSDQDGLAWAGTYNPQVRGDRVHPAYWRNPGDLPQFAYLYREPRLGEVTIMRSLSHTGREDALHHVDFFPKVVWYSTLRLFNLVDEEQPMKGSYQEMGLPRWSWALITTSGYVLFALAAIGAVMLATGAARLPRGPAWLWAVPVLMAAGVVWFLGFPRYRAPLDPFLAMLAAAALAGLAGLSYRRAWRSRRMPSA